MEQWAQLGIGLREAQIKVRVQANNLHILCEASQSPRVGIVIPRLLRLLAATNLEDLLPPQNPPVYQVYVYSRVSNQSRPSWAKLIYLNQLDRYLEQLDPSSKARSSSATPPQVPAEQPELSATAVASCSALVLSNYSLARQGNGDAIARYLSETLSALEVAVQVSVKAIDYPAGTNLEQQQRNRRLCVFCDSTYSPDPALIAEPITQKLRDLRLSHFRDAIVLSRVIGEDTINWTLRIDLTPAEEMLEEWARWGDVQAIVCLLNQSLEVQAITLTASLKESTLHLLCEQTPGRSNGKAAPDRGKVLQVVAPLLEKIAPQGILAAALYGQVAGQDVPVWVEWLTLPATLHAALASSALNLAHQGDQPALLFLLHRLLNPDLDWWLATGGLRVQLLPRDHLLHIMVDGPTCPKQEQVTTEAVKLIRQLQVPKLVGLRIYGRRAGQKRPLWNYGFDFVQRHRLVPQPTPEFAASDAYVGALLLEPGDLVPPADPIPPDLPTQLVRIPQRLVEGCRRFLILTQIFAATEPESSSAMTLLPESTPPALLGAGQPDGRTALVWTILGLLLVLGSDRLLGEFLQLQARMHQEAALAETTPVVQPKPPAQPTKPAAIPNLPNLSLNKSGQDRRRVFNSSGFTQTDTASPPPLEPSNIANIASSSVRIENPLDSPQNQWNRPLVQEVPSRYPTFNTRQLDRQLALYLQHISESGPPDILIVGSSRALRGIDPVALEKALAAAGHPNLRVFNFGINGATVQVVHLLVRELLTPAQLPKFILWADGARAFNSGRIDITYNGVLASAGYKSLTQERRSTLTSSPSLSQGSAPALGPTSQQPSAPTTPAFQLSSYAAVNDFLNQKLAAVSAVYPQQEQLQTFLRDRLAAWLPRQKLTSAQLLAQQNLAPTHNQNQPATQTKLLSPEAKKDSLLQAIDFSGFMPLSIRFNPTTYYQKFARVSGDFDSDYEAFQLEGKQAEALDALVQFLAERQIPLVFVNLPLTEDYLDPVRSEYEQQFQEFILQKAIGKGFVFRNLVDLWPNETDYFSDPSHLNRYGAYEVSNRLAQDPLITWPK
ncbi:hypothetical protein BST81_22330 [Leptolyngbya sp. 'hensonii']|nr:hypothetical protein BST81_22330 [Leptolyngbya sp. 'hensonii']